MGKKDPRVDSYIAKSADFAKPILKHIRGLVHATCPEVEETMKWSMPHFQHRGNLCYMAAFKQHCSFGFWKRSLIFQQDENAPQSEGQALGQFGRITSISDLPAEKVLIGYITEAVRLNEAGVKRPAQDKSKVKKLVVPDYFMSALRKNKKALAVFEKFSPSHKREYVEWITEAKTEETRQRRMATALEWMAEGKPRNWKYMNR
jgi:uncharacterized protein YdeI (YjbR/CyaY-like superfamily)